MSTSSPNRSGEMQVFTEVIERGGFSAAAKALSMSPSSISKLVARLEARLGARLLHRSTRQLQLTPEGTLFYERCVAVLADIDAAEREAASGTTPRGRVRINANIPFGMHKLLPLIPGLKARYPDLELDIALTDAVVDLIEARADIAIRAGLLRSSPLRARKLGESGFAIVGSTDYLARNGTPKTAADLRQHQRLGFSFSRSVPDWQLLEGGRTVTFANNTGIHVSDGESLRRLALTGIGLVRLNCFHIGPDIRAGRLIPVLEDCNPGDIEELHAVYLGHAGPLPTRVRAVIDYLVETVTLP